MRGCPGTCFGFVNHGPFPLNDIIVYAIFCVRLDTFFAVKSFGIGFVFAKQQLRIAVTIQVVLAQFFMAGEDIGALGMHFRFFFITAPGPGIPEPDGGKQGNCRRFLMAVGNGNFYQNISGTCLGIFNKYIEIIAFIKDTGIQ